MSIENIARVCHEANAEYCRTLGDHSQPAWDIAPDWQRSSAENGVMFHIENPEAGDAASHENWMKEKLADGWSYGPIKDPANKKHHCIVPFNELPPEQQAKDRLFRAIVHALA